MSAREPLPNSVSPREEGERDRIRLLLFNLATDADDPILGFTTGWISALAPHAKFIDVVTMRVGRLDVPANVRVFSVGKERGYSEARRAVEFYRILRGLLVRRQYDACFAHMMPLFAVMAFPLLWLRRVPITVWYTHESASMLLRLAERVAETVVTASPGSFPLPSAKVLVTGHGIDTTAFQPSVQAGLTRQEKRTLVSVGRIGRVKNLDVLIEAVRILVHEEGMTDLAVRVVGPVNDGDEVYASDLQRRVASAGLQHTVRFVGPVSPAHIVDEYHRASVVVNLKPGGLDKAVLEAMACGVPVVACNPAFAATFVDSGWLLSRPDDPRAVARACRRLLDMTILERGELGRQLRQAVVERHSLQRLGERLASDILWARHASPRVVEARE